MSPKSPATIDDLRQVPEDGRVYELVDGTIVVTPAGARHSNVAARITVVLGNFVIPRDLGDVYTEGVGIQLPNGNVRSPDVSFTRAEKLPDGRSPIDYGDGTVIPDLVVEVLSPSDRPIEMAKKVTEYLGFGILVWVVDPEHRTVTAYRPPDVAAEYAGDDVLTAESVLPGFSCRVSEFFPR